MKAPTVTNMLRAYQSLVSEIDEYFSAGNLLDDDTFQKMYDEAFAHIQFQNEVKA